MIEQWCKTYVYKWLHVENEPSEGWIAYCLYKIFFRWRTPLKAFRGLKRGPTKFKVVGHTVVPLASIDYSHPVTNDFSDLKLKKRITALKQMPKRQFFSKADIQEVMPSINGIRVMLQGSRYKLCDGHGRVFALKQVYPQAHIEVDLIELDRTSRVSDLFPSHEGERALVKFPMQSPQQGDLRIIRRFAMTPVELWTKKSAWLQVYFSLQRFLDIPEDYGADSQWETVINAIDEQIPSLLVDPDPVKRVFGQKLVDIRRGNEALIAPEEKQTNG
jgi:hypothetical protein